MGVGVSAFPERDGSVRVFGFGNRPSAALKKNNTVSALLSGIFSALDFIQYVLACVGGLIQVNIGQEMRLSCLRNRAKDEKAGTASMSTFTAVAIDLLTSEHEL